MSKKSTRAAKGRRASGAFVAFPCEMLSHPNRKALSSKANKLLFDLVEQLRLKSGGPCNNGDLGVYWRKMKDMGWRSKETLWNAVRELEYYGFIKQTKQGGLHSPSLYALTWFAINDCKGKLDVKETIKPSNEWMLTKQRFRPARKNKIKLSVPIIVQPQYDMRVNPSIKSLSLTEIVALCPHSTVCH